MKKLIFILLVFSACTTPQKKITEQPAPQEPDTTFLFIEDIKGKVWVDAFMAKQEVRQHLQSFINDTVVKSYFGDAPYCWDENYTSWEKYYDCYKICSDTIEYIAKLLPNPKNDSKYIVSEFSWTRTYIPFKLYIEPDTRDTVLFLKYNESLGYEKYNTLTWLIAKKKITYPILLNK